MVLHIVCCVKHKRHKNTKFPEFPAGDSQNRHKSDRFRPFSRPYAEADQRDRLRLRQPAKSPTWRQAGQAQTPGTTIRQDSPQKLSPTTVHGGTRGIVNRSFNEIRKESESSSCSAARARSWHLPLVTPRIRPKTHWRELAPYFSLRSRAA